MRFSRAGEENNPSVDYVDSSLYTREPPKLSLPSVVGDWL